MTKALIQIIFFNYIRPYNQICLAALVNFGVSSLVLGVCPNRNCFDGVRAGVVSSPSKSTRAGSITVTVIELPITLQLLL